MRPSQSPGSSDAKRDTPSLPPLTTSGTEKEKHVQEKPKEYQFKPRTPRRIRWRRELLSSDWQEQANPSQPSSSRRSSLGGTLSEALNLRAHSHNKTGLGRGLDADIAGWEEYRAEVVSHRIENKRAQEQQDRKKAARWRQRQVTRMQHPKTPPSTPVDGPENAGLDAEYLFQKGAHLSQKGREVQTPQAIKRNEVLSKLPSDLGASLSTARVSTYKQVQVQFDLRRQEQDFGVNVDRVREALLDSPESENHTVHEIFVSHAFFSKERVDHSELHKVLDNLGFRPNNQAECQAISRFLSKVANDLEVEFFVFRDDIFPQVRAQLAELRRAELLKACKKVMTDRGIDGKVLDKLSVLQVVSVLRYLGNPETKVTLLQEVSKAVLDYLPGLRPLLWSLSQEFLTQIEVLTPHHMCILIPIVQERLRQRQWRLAQLVEEELLPSAQMQELWGKGGLAFLKESFDNQPKDNLGGDSISLLRLVHVADDVSLLPKRGNFRDLLMKLVEAEKNNSAKRKSAVQKVEDGESSEQAVVHAAEDSGISFSQCLAVMTAIRSEECNYLRCIFRSHGDSLSLNQQECWKCLERSGIRANGEDEEEELSQLVACYYQDEHWRNRDAQLDAELLLDLVKFLVPRRRQLQRCHAFLKAEVNGWEDQAIQHAMDVFIEVDRDLNGRLEETELLDAIQLLRPSWPARFSVSFLQQLVARGVIQSFNEIGVLPFFDVLYEIDVRMDIWQFGKAVSLKQRMVEGWLAFWTPKETRRGFAMLADLIDALEDAGHYKRKITWLEQMVREGKTEVDLKQFLKIVGRSTSSEAVDPPEMPTFRVKRQIVGYLDCEKGTQKEEELRQSSSLVFEHLE